MLCPVAPPPSAMKKPRKAPTAHLIVSEARSGGSMNISTAYPNYNSRMKSAEAAAAAAEAGGGGGRHLHPQHDGLSGAGEEGKYDWHTVVDGLSK